MNADDHLNADDHSDHSHDTHHDHDDDQHVDLNAVVLRELLIERGIVTAEEIRQKIEEWEQRSPTDGARVVVRAWLEPDFKARLLADAREALAEFGVSHTVAPRLIVLENTGTVHHLVVCTLCSCYPRQLLGFPPSWYKSLEYRARAVRDPRGVLREFGTILPDGVEVKVVDSTADCRYLVLPLPPADYRDRSREDLVPMVTRDSMIGVRLVQSAGQTWPRRHTTEP